MTRRRNGTAVAFVLAAMIVAGAGCLPDHTTLDCDGDGVVRIAVAGDSNSSSVDQSTWVLSLSHRLAAIDPARWTVVDFAIPNAGIVRERAHPMLAGGRQVREILAMRPPADVAILAFGTNDLLRRHSPRRLLRAYRRQRARLERAGITVFVALTPPCFLPGACDLTEIVEGNALLRATWPQGVVDFSSWVDPAAHMDSWGLHFNAVGQRARLAAAWRTLVGAGASRAACGCGRSRGCRARREPRGHDRDDGGRGGRLADVRHPPATAAAPRSTRPA